MADIHEKDDEFFGDMTGDGDDHDHDHNNNNGIVTSDIIAPTRHQDGSGGMSFYEERANNDRFRNLGYHEAYETTKEQALQKGFEDGYKQSIDISLQIGEQVGKLGTLWMLQGRERSKPEQQQREDELRSQAQDVTKKIVEFSNQQNADAISQVKCSDIVELHEDIKERVHSTNR
mmetsp:Transcript_9866/g.13902  ORF Transcript_9866/g.13902 Transcript_9866/m.13902 type:complete len:175 (+) Transcript_9866:173-697(+)